MFTSRKRCSEGGDGVRYVWGGWGAGCIRHSSLIIHSGCWRWEIDNGSLGAVGTWPVAAAPQTSLACVTPSAGLVRQRGAGSGQSCIHGGQCLRHASPSVCFRVNTIDRAEVRFTSIQVVEFFFLKEYFQLNLYQIQDTHTLPPW